MKLMTLCADDFALSLQGSERILQLLEMGRLSATSVMSESRYWPQLASELMAKGEAADIGLHFNLTEAFGIDAKPLGYWLSRSQLHLLDKTAIKRSLLTQIELFAEQAGRLPDFIDGHQHVHALPVIRQALWEVLAERWPRQHRPYLRGPDRLADGGDARFKGQVLKTCCRQFSRQAEQQGYLVPQWFAGLYSLSAHADFAGLMRVWLQHAPDQALLMCHPGWPDADDEIGAAREQEYRYLVSEDFANDCEQQRVRLGRFTPTTAFASLSSL